MNAIEVIVLVLVITLFVNYVGTSTSEVSFVKSKVDGARYLVRTMHDMQKAADILARLAAKLERIVASFLEKHPKDRDAQRLRDNYDKGSLSEGTEDSKFTSYSVNKGEKIVMCLRSRDGNMKLADENVLAYVAIHELGHLMTKEIGHTSTFWKNFKRLLQHAIDTGEYKRVDYKKKPVRYCGMDIKSSVV